jgi:hypothetical protein
MKRRATTRRQQVKMSVDHECSIVSLSHSQIREMRDDPYSFAVNPGDIVKTCGVRHQEGSEAQKKCFAAFHAEIQTAW